MAAKNKKSWDSILISILGAAVLLIAFDAWINDFIAMPLRVISTTISEIVVGICGYDVSREGTSLVVGTFRFNVDTACSGSQTMQQMLAAAIVLVGVLGRTVTWAEIYCCSYCLAYCCLCQWTASKCFDACKSSCGERAD